MKISSLVFLIALLIGAQANAAYVQTPFPVTKGGTGTTTSTGSGSVVLSTSPSLVTPALGTPTAITLTNGTGLPIATGVSGLAGGIATLLATPTSANLAAAITDETGTGALVFANSPTLVTPALGTPSALVGTNITGTAAALSIGGNAATATALQTARTINGVSFNGTANITIPQAALVVTDGGNTAYTILSTDDVVRTTTTITADRAYTLPVCNASNIGEKHIIKDTPAQTHNITLTAAGSDNIDGNATFTLLPGDSATVICGAFSSSGTWDLN